MIPLPPRATLVPYTTLFRSPGTEGATAVGTELDHRNRLWVAGGSTGEARVYNARTGTLRRTYQLAPADRKSTRLNSSHANISYAVFCLKKKKEFIFRAIASS